MTDWRALCRRRYQRSVEVRVDVCWQAESQRFDELQPWNSEALADTRVPVQLSARAGVPPAEPGVSPAVAPALVFEWLLSRSRYEEALREKLWTDWAGEGSPKPLALIYLLILTLTLAV